MNDFAPNTSDAYKAACATHSDASAAHDKALEAYRAGSMDDDAYLTARAAYEMATAAFDTAYAEEVARGEAAEKAERAAKRAARVAAKNRQQSFITMLDQSAGDKLTRYDNEPECLLQTDLDAMLKLEG